MAFPISNAINDFRWNGEMICFAILFHPAYHVIYQPKQQHWNDENGTYYKLDIFNVERCILCIYISIYLHIIKWCSCWIFFWQKNNHKINWIERLKLCFCIGFKSIYCYDIFFCLYHFSFSLTVNHKRTFIVKNCVFLCECFNAKRRIRRIWLEQMTFLRNKDNKKKMNWIFLNVKNWKKIYVLLDSSKL